MTTGLDDNVNDPSCTEDTCLNFLSTPGTRWAYHNAIYPIRSKLKTLLAIFKLVHASKIKTPTGMNGLFINLVMTMCILVLLEVWLDLDY